MVQYYLDMIDATKKYLGISIPHLAKLYHQRFFIKNFFVIQDNFAFFLIFFLQFQEKLQRLIVIHALINYVNVIVNLPCAYRNICLVRNPRPCAKTRKGCGKICWWDLDRERVYTILNIRYVAFLPDLCASQYYETLFEFFPAEPREAPRGRLRQGSFKWR